MTQDTRGYEEESPQAGQEELGAGARESARGLISVRRIASFPRRGRAASASHLLFGFASRELLDAYNALNLRALMAAFDAGGSAYQFVIFRKF